MKPGWGAELSESCSLLAASFSLLDQWKVGHSPLGQWMVALKTVLMSNMLELRPYKGSTYRLHRRYFTGQSKKEFIGNKADTNDIESDCCRANSAISSDYRLAKGQRGLMKAVCYTKTRGRVSSLKASSVRRQFRKTIFELLASTHT